MLVEKFVFVRKIDKFERNDTKRFSNKKNNLFWCPRFHANSVVVLWQKNYNFKLSQYN